MFGTPPVHSDGAMKNAASNVDVRAMVRQRGEWGAYGLRIPSDAGLGWTKGKKSNSLPTGTNRRDAE